MFVYLTTLSSSSTLFLFLFFIFYFFNFFFNCTTKLEYELGDISPRNKMVIRRSISHFNCKKISKSPNHMGKFIDTFFSNHICYNLILFWIVSIYIYIYIYILWVNILICCKNIMKLLLLLLLLLFLLVE